MARTKTFRGQRPALHVFIIAAGHAYLRAAAAAAATFALRGGPATTVSVLLPKSAPAAKVLDRASQRFGFTIERFPFEAGEPDYFTCWLKCQAFVWALKNLVSTDIALFADADTCCLKPIVLPLAVRKKILAGQVGLAPDIVDHHFQHPEAPWYLAPNERCPYVNSGVIFAARKALSFFECVLQLSREPRFLVGPFQDQKVINFALGKRFSNALIALDRRFNAIHSVTQKTVIAHFAGGAGLLERQPRGAEHLKMCSEVLAGSGALLEA